MDDWTRQRLPTSLSLQVLFDSVDWDERRAQHWHTCQREVLLHLRDWAEQQARDWCMVCQVGVEEVQMPGTMQDVIPDVILSVMPDVEGVAGLRTFVLTWLLPSVIGLRSPQVL